MFFFILYLLIRIFICNTTVGLIDLSVKEVTEFMRKLGINEEYVESAEDNEVNGASIFNLPDKQLRTLLGIKKNPVAFLHFKYSVKRKFGGQVISPLGVKCLPPQTAEFCHRFEVLKSAAEIILQYKIDGEMLWEADTEVLEKISKDAHEARKVIDNNLEEYVTKLN